MSRDQLCTQAFWDKWAQYETDRIAEMQYRITQPSGNPSYRPQYVFSLAKEHWHLVFYKYSQGAPVVSLVTLFPAMLDAWELSNRLYLDFHTEADLWERQDWQHNLDHYIVCFWLVGLALSLELEESLWQRLLALLGNEGHDILLDRIIATRQADRKIGTRLCHGKPYQRLLKAIDAPKTEQAGLLQEFVNHWFKELDRPARKGVSKPYARPYWYTYGDQNLEGGAYFGRWCVEAVAAVKAFGLDDSLCLGHIHYPGDLLRPDGPSTHPQPPQQEETLVIPSVQKKRSWFRRIFGK